MLWDTFRLLFKWEMMLNFEDIILLPRSSSVRDVWGGCNRDDASIVDIESVTKIRAREEENGTIMKCMFFATK